MGVRVRNADSRADGGHWSAAGSATVGRVMPFAAGREADVFALDDGRVLRRYRDGGDATREAGVMGYVREWGYPVPEVYSADGAEIVMERLDGPTMAQALVAGTFSIGAAATMLADLLGRLHRIPGQSGEGTIGHYDFHPENVLLTSRGPVVIDWRNADDGPADLDTALCALILAQVAIGSLEHAMSDKAGELLDLFLDAAPGDPLSKLERAVEIRSGQWTMSADEVAALGTAAARVRRE
jgi:tRNA A-37 threonylcarbamoyl transferase component Bud32